LILDEVEKYEGRPPPKACARSRQRG